VPAQAIFNDTTRRIGQADRIPAFYGAIPCWQAAAPYGVRRRGSQLFIMGDSSRVGETRARDRSGGRGRETIALMKSLAREWEAPARPQFNRARLIEIRT